MRKINNLIIESDERLLIVKKLLPSILGKLDIDSSLILVTSSNELFAMVRDTVIFKCDIHECIPGYELYIDPKTFDQEINESCLIGDDEYIVNTDILSIQKLRERVGMYYYNKPSKPDYLLIDMQENPEIKEYLNLKSDNGARFYKDIDANYMIPIFTKFPSLAKSDKADLYIYNYGAIHQIVEIIIHKKKINRDVSMIYKILRI